jgi:hypothetical protein
MFLDGIIPTLSGVKWRNLGLEVRDLRDSWSSSRAELLRMTRDVGFSASCSNS